MPSRSKTPPRGSSPRLSITVPTAEKPVAEYTIDELAREASTTVRNVRAYQDRGLLPPPTKRGRTGYYSHSHLGRLRLIGNLLSRGYTLGNIGELFAGMEKGHDLRQIIGLESAISSPWSAEQPRTFTAVELLRLFGPNFNPRTLAKVIELGLIEPDGINYRAHSPNILIAGAEFAKAGLPLEDMLNVIGSLRSNVERVADELVQMVARLLDRYGKGRLPPRDDIQKLADLVWRIRPLGMMAVESEVSRALERSANKFLGDRVAQILEHMQGRSSDD